MLHRFFSLFRPNRSLADHISQGKFVVIDGIKFRIKKLDVMNYLEGAKVMQEIYAIYKNSEQKQIDEKTITSLKKTREIMKDIILSGVIHPKITRTKEDQGIHIDDVLSDWSISNQLVNAIIEFTAPKKK